MTTRHLCFALALGLGLAPRAAAPSDATASSPVVLDLVVRDKKNAPVVDLKAEEVELFVDGVKQPFEGFRRVTIPRGGGAAPRAPRPGAPGSPCSSSRGSRGWSAISPATRPRSS